MDLEVDASKPSLRDRARRFLRRRRELRALDEASKRLSATELAALVSDLGYPRAREFYAMQKPAEIAAFLERVKSTGGRNVLEIGTAAGGSLFLLCRAAANDALIVSVDLPGGEFGGGFEEDRAHFYRRFAGRGQSLVLVRGDSHDASTVERVRELFAGRGALDAVFVDGDHSLAGVTADHQCYWPLVRPGGLMAFHDIQAGAGPWGGDVPEFWARIRGTAHSEELVAEASMGGYGIGVLWKGAPEHSPSRGV